MAAAVLIISSLDTRAEEVGFLKSEMERRGYSVMLLDISMRGQFTAKADITCDAVAEAGGSNIADIKTGSRSRDENTAIMVKGAIKKTLDLLNSGKISGIIGIGGTSNTAMSTWIMQAMPFGIPKFMVSSGAAIPRYAGGFFGSSDITIMSSPVEINGLNPLTENILLRAAGAICGMVEAGSTAVIEDLKCTGKSLIPMTQYQYSEGCCKLVAEALENRQFTVIPFHADGVGDKAMEKLVSDGVFDAVIDIVPAGLSEELLGGNRAAGPARLEAAGKYGIPQIITPCGFDMLSCGPLQRKDNNDALWVSRNIASRKYYVQDAYRVQARTTADELRIVARAMTTKLNAATGSVIILLPMQGWSLLSVKGQPLYDPEADAAFIDELRQAVRPNIEIREFDLPLNSSEFAGKIVDAFLELVKPKQRLPYRKISRGNS
jgi:uncharacterized protein (UPF0261 family)